MHILLSWSFVLWCGHKIFRLYGWFLSLPLINSGKVLKYMPYDFSVYSLKSTYSVKIFKPQGKNRHLHVHCPTVLQIYLQIKKNRQKAPHIEPTLFLIFLVHGNVVLKKLFVLWQWSGNAEASKGCSVVPWEGQTKLMESLI